MYPPPPSAPPAPPPRLSARVNSLFSEGDSAFELASAQDSIEKNRVKCLELGSRTKASWAVGIESPGRHMLHCQKRPTTVSKEPYYSVKRDLLQCQKRPTTYAHASSTTHGALGGCEHSTRAT